RPPRATLSVVGAEARAHAAGVPAAWRKGHPRRLAAAAAQRVGDRGLLAIHTTVYTPSHAETEDGWKPCGAVDDRLSRGSLAARQDPGHGRTRRFPRDRLEGASSLPRHPRERRASVMAKTMVSIEPGIFRRIDPRSGKELPKLWIHYPGKDGKT